MMRETDAVRLNRLALAEASAETGTLPARIVVTGVEAICDPTGALYLPETRTLVVSDLHLEKGAAYARRGAMLPPYDTLATLRVLDAVVARHDPKVVVSLGDSFHDRVGSAHMPDIFRERLVAMARGRDWIWINGNHDPDGIGGLPGEAVDELRFAGLSFRHEPSAGGAAGEVAGHLHPSATVRRREKSVRRPCFATDGSRLVMPAFGVMTGGLDLRHKAMVGLFDLGALVAHLLGRDRIYSVRYANLLG